MCSDDISIVAVGPRLHYTFDELENSALDGLRNRVVIIADEALLQLMAGN